MYKVIEIPAFNQDSAVDIVTAGIESDGWDSVFWTEKPRKTWLDTSDADRLNVLTDAEARATCPDMMKGGR